MRTRDLTATFGSPLGAQLVDVYVHDPAAAATSTAASFPQRNYAIAAPGAWSRLLEVQGFGQRFVDAGGATVGTITIHANALTRYIAFRVPKTALGGTPAAGWAFTVVLPARTASAPTRPAASRRRRRPSSSACARRRAPTRTARSTRPGCRRRWT